MDVHIRNPIVGAGGVGAGEGLGIDPFGRATVAFYLGPRRDWRTCRRVEGRGQRLLAAGRAVMGSTGPGALWAQPLDLGGDGSGALPRRSATPAGLGQPAEHHHEQEHEPARIGRHGRPHDMV
jgi:hypothetical protein